MNSLELALMGIKNLLRRKARTILTVLGVIIGTASIVVMVSLGLGMNKAFEQQLEEYGSLTMIEVYNNRGGYMVMSDSGESSSVPEGEVAFNDETISTFENIEHVEFALGMKRFDGTLYAGKLQSWAGIMAVDLEKFKKLDIDLSEGTMPSADGVNEVLMGFRVSEDFYDPNSRNPYSNQSSVDVMNTKLEVVPSSSYYDGKRPRGFVITPTGLTSEEDWDYAWDIFIDYDVFTKLKADFDRRNKNNDDDNGGRKRSRSNEDQDKYDQMKISVDDVKYVQEVQEQVKEMGYEAYSLTDALENMKQTSGLIQAVLGGIGAVSLFVAAIGITNTMVMSIYERTKEIGVMKVIGAELKDIKRLFLFEAAMIGFFGGVFGVVISYGISFLINSVLSGMSEGGGYYGVGFLSDIPYWLALLGIAFSTFIGLAAGYYPAVRATRLSALEAIRTE
ncbi:ABC transporter permease [Fusibacter paucivorans]|uniref:ABC transporter permease n=1 Tax=Fusibacter paucivorans TaxID=76009 RepID=A0ABS5PKX6_9FIRM|nr:ABC transporter permease [Fusibacter paucivorans]MBS7525686.1 ABC transporter permease [Fusibacter paucivorans]